MKKLTLTISTETENDLNQVVDHAKNLGFGVKIWERRKPGIKWGEGKKSTYRKKNVDHDNKEQKEEV